jgi:HK97 family phage major capsid protein
MPQIANLAEATPQEVDARLEELRHEFINMQEGRRSDGTGDYDAAMRAMRAEVDELDTWNTMSVARRRAQQARVAATAGPWETGNRSSIGELFVTDEMMAALERGGPMGQRSSPVEITVDGMKRMASLAYEIEIKNDEPGPGMPAGRRSGTEATRWLRSAGIYGGYNITEGYRAPLTEWGTTGPPAFDTTTAGALVPVQSQAIPPVPRQARLYLADLMPRMPTTFPTVPYVRELNPTTYEQIVSGGASTVPEGVTKPSAMLNFQPAQAPVTVIATTLTLSKQMFLDAPAVIAYINQRLPYLVKLREDQEFLTGSGTWPDITGILNTPGHLTNAGVAGQHAISIGNGFAQIENQDGVPTAVVMNPTDAWAMFTLRAAGGSGTFDAGTPFSTLPLTVWGVPTYRSRVYPPGSCLVCDFERGAMIVDRESVNLQTYNERYAEQNLVLLICEERLGLMVFRPDLFCEVSLP